MKKNAFTMLELVFVIVVVGILSAVFIPRFERDNAGEAAYQIARHIRLAQHYALIEDRADDAPVGVKWQATLWRITFVSGSNGDCYMVHADRDGNGGNPGADERARDPQTGNWVWGGQTCSDATANVNEDVLLWKSYGVNSVDVACEHAGIKNIAFDHMGRPGQIVSSDMDYFDNDCTVTIGTNDSHTATISISKESGLTRVTSINGVAI
jgi:prepilin-type N-terminal cleavage/methylation domain-containing protein